MLLSYMAGQEPARIVRSGRAGPAILTAMATERGQYLHDWGCIHRIRSRPSACVTGAFNSVGIFDGYLNRIYSESTAQAVAIQSGFWACVRLPGALTRPGPPHLHPYMHPRCAVEGRLVLAASCLRPAFPSLAGQASSLVRVFNHPTARADLPPPLCVRRAERRQIDTQSHWRPSSHVELEATMRLALGRSQSHSSPQPCASRRCLVVEMSD